MHHSPPSRSARHHVCNIRRWSRLRSTLQPCSVARCVHSWQVLTARDAIAYASAQIIAGFAGGGLGRLSLPAANLGAYPAFGANVSHGNAFLAELVITFALAHAVLHVATTTAQANNSYYGLAIGFTVLSGAISVGGVSGGCFNPAVAMLAVVQGKANEEIWVHIAGPLVAGALAGGFFRLTHPNELDGGTMMAQDIREKAAPFLIEFVGTFMLSFTVACAASPANTSGLAPLSIGSILMVQVYSGGATSGGMYNPAVTLAVLTRKQLARKVDPDGNFATLTAVGYILVQCVASLCAGGVARAVVPAIGFPAVSTETGRAFSSELVATFFLCTVVLQSATSSKTTGNSFFGLAIGYTVASMAVTVGSLSGGAFNPAVALLAFVSGETIQSSFWVSYQASPAAHTPSHTCVHSMRSLICCMCCRSTSSGRRLAVCSPGSSSASPATTSSWLPLPQHTSLHVACLPR